ncbi:putative membrane protein [Leifsonia rubra CMS 76R]|nr:putative membrane protein [Leifsonia rubra CMS 76R]
MTRLHPVIRSVGDASRGALIGFAEIVPGVSGGTIALLVGVYDTLIDGAGHLARGVARTIGDGIRGRGLSRAAAHFRSVRWNVVLPIGIGMLLAIVVGAALLAPLLEAYPAGTRAVFAGLIAASLIVPARMVGGRWTPQEVLIGLLASALTFALTGLPRAGEAEPTLLIVAVAAAFAICALVLPGVSGSYVLLIVGMYAPTLAAVNDRNFAYLGTFILGAIVGLGLFVSALQWLLHNRRRITLVIMTGLMLGSLRALWPWQTESGAILPPADDLGPVLLLILAGASVVLGIMAAEAGLMKRRMLSPEIIADPEPHVPEPETSASDGSAQSEAGLGNAPG